MQQPGGIRSKIMFWFYLLLAFMVGISTITYWIVSRIEGKLHNIETVDTFLANTLEVRRMEKNFLLYNDPKALQQGEMYLDALTGQLADNEELFVRLSSQQDINTVRSALQDYGATFARLGHSELSRELAALIREQGNELIMLTEDLVVMERRAIQRLIRLISNTLLLTLPLLIVLFSAAAALLGRGIVSSLKKLERHAALIATGNFVEAPFTSSNHEINSLISAFNRMSRELKKRQQQLVKSEKLASLGTMLAGVAHELNNPLSNISSSAELLDEEIGPANTPLAHQLLDQIHLETQRSISIVQTLLSLARHENFQRRHYPLRALLQEIVLLLKGQIPRGVEIRLAVGEELSVFVDKQKIQQAILNLLKNSIDALAGKGIIQIKAWQKQGGIKIVIADDGPGIPVQLKDKIFDPFFTTKDTGQGSGLGLFIVHEIVSQHGGTIHIDLQRQAGAAFIINLPGKEKS
ncbi:MAG: hypothetical protein C0613_11805 [Desulfobulbaceae bacterium]|nr:MAG: hypothetical protein C0613_11805 [Desulfobulbaceae bacterium]